MIAALFYATLALLTAVMVRMAVTGRRRDRERTQRAHDAAAEQLRDIARDHLTNAPPAFPAAAQPVPDDIRYEDALASLDTCICDPDDDSFAMSQNGGSLVCTVCWRRLFPLRLPTGMRYIPEGLQDAFDVDAREAAAREQFARLQTPPADVDGTVRIERLGVPSSRGGDQ